MKSKTDDFLTDATGHELASLIEALECLRRDQADWDPLLCNLLAAVRTDAQAVVTRRAAAKRRADLLALARDLPAQEHPVLAVREGMILRVKGRVGIVFHVSKITTERATWVTVHAEDGSGTFKTRVRDHSCVRIVADVKGGD